MLMRRVFLLLLFQGAQTYCQENGPKLIIGRCTYQLATTCGNSTEVYFRSLVEWKSEKKKGYGFRRFDDGKKNKRGGGG